MYNYAPVKELYGTYSVAKHNTCKALKLCWLDSLQIRVLPSQCLSGWFGLQNVNYGGTVLPIHLESES